MRKRLENSLAVVPITPAFEGRELKKRIMRLKPGWANRASVPSQPWLHREIQTKKRINE